MTSRRAVSPVIATVILIAVAVALGIAVAVWAGALTGGLQKSEKLLIYPYVGGAGSVLNITITNSSPTSATITQVLFNSAPMPTSLPYTLASGASGFLLNSSALTVKSGITYPITVVTAAGNSYPSTIVWP